MPRTRRVALDSEIKAAISDLTHKEKDKLLFRLLPKEPDLVRKLRFDLLEGGDTVEIRREELAEAIRGRIDSDVVPNFYSPGYLLLDLRAMSGGISRHVKTTKDKFGEVSLNFLMLNHSLPRLVDQINATPKHRSHTLNDYVVKRGLKLLKLMGKLHPDLHIEFRDDMKLLGETIGRLPGMMKTAIYAGLDVNWLLAGEVPEI